MVYNILRIICTARLRGQLNAGEWAGGRAGGQAGGQIGAGVAFG